MADIIYRPRPVVSLEAPVTLPAVAVVSLRAYAVSGLTGEPDPYVPPVGDPFPAGASRHILFAGPDFFRADGGQVYSRLPVGTEGLLDPAPQWGTILDIQEDDQWNVQPDMDVWQNLLGVALTGGRSQVTVLVRQFTDQPPPAKGGRFRLRGKWHVITGIRRMSPAGKVRTLAVSGVHFDELPGMATYTWDAAPEGYGG